MVRPQTVLPNATESVEDRVLLSAPTLIKIASTNTGELLSTDPNNPDTLSVAPEQFTLTFDPGQELDVASAREAITVTQPDGSDANIGYIGQGASSNELVVRFAENLPDGSYTLNIGATLQNTGGEFFNDTEDSGTGEAQDVPFNLDLGAQVVAVVPQPVSTSGTLSQSRNQIVVYFNNDDLDPVLAATPAFYQLINAEPNPINPNDTVRLPTSVDYDETTDSATLTFAGNVEDLFGNGESLFRLRIGTNESQPGAPTRIDTTGSASTTFGYLTDEDSDGVDEFVNVTFHLAAPVAGTSQEGKSVQLNITANAAATSATPLIAANLTTGQIDITLSSNPAAQTTLAGLLSAIASDANAGQLIRVEVAPNSNLLAEIGSTLAVAGESYTLFDSGSSFRTAGDDSGRVADVGLLDPSGVIITAAIEPQFYPFDFPGASDEPGQREIELFRFVPSFDTRFHPGFVDEPNLIAGSFDRFPMAAVDPGIINGPGVETLFYNFQTFVGFDPEGLERTNTITENQKQRVREVFDFYSEYLGVQFVETPNRGFTIARSDLRVLNGEFFNGAGDGIVGAADPARQLAILDASENWNDTFGDYTDPQGVGTVNFFEEAMEVVGLLLGLGQTDHLPDRTVMGEDNVFFTTGNSNSVELDYPGDHDVVGGQVVHPPESKDIDLYRFAVTEPGRFNAEVVAERLTGEDTSLLDATLQLYLVTEESPGGAVLESTLIARNDDYFSEDPFIDLDLSPGVYFIGVSASGNDDYDPTIEDTGINGTSQGKYELNLDFRPAPGDGDALTDTTGTAFDGDHDGVAGGVANFWFRAVQEADTYFVNRTESIASGNFNTLAGGARVYNEIDAALAAAGPGTIVRIVGNDAGQGYEIGRSGINLRDGRTLEVPAGVTVMIDAGAILKLNAARIGVGSFDQVTDRSGGNLQVLGTPDQSVVFTSWKNESIGGNTTPTPTTPGAGDWGGIVFQEDIDRAADGRTVHSDDGIFLNYVAFGEFTYGGGRLTVGSTEQTVNPIHTIGARPTVLHNTIVLSSDSAMSADPDSFAESVHSDYARSGPEIYGNLLSQTTDNLLAVDTVDGEGNPIRVQNASNGLFIRVLTPAGTGQNTLSVSARFDDTDIPHILTENLVIQGTPGGHLDTVETPELDAGAPNQTQLTSTGVGDLPYGTYSYRMTYVNRDGGGSILHESPPSDPSESIFISGDPTTGGAIQLTNLPAATGAFNGRRLYRSHDGIVYTLVAELNASTTSFVDNQFASGPALDTRSFDQSVARYDARLTIDPGVLIKSEDAGIQVGIGAQLIAEGVPGREIIFTSRKDDSYGAGGTFDTNDDASVADSPLAAPGDWGGIFVGHLSSASISDALITYGGGAATVAGGFATFNAIEVHQAQARIVNTILENNADGTGSASPAHRYGRGNNGSAVIFVRGSQPVIANNIIRNNSGAAISINANALNHESVTDWGRTRGEIIRIPGYVGNQGPLIDENIVDGTTINGLQVRGEVLTTESVWDDTGIVHVVLNDEIVIPDVTTFGGLRLESNSTESLVVKLSGDNAGFTAVGRPLDIEDRIGGTLHIIGQPGKPVVLTSLLDDSVGAGFNLEGLPQNDTNNDGSETGAGGDPTDPMAGPLGPLQITGTTNNGNALRDALLGSGITPVGDARFTGSNVSAGFFEFGFESFGMSDGIVLATGHARQAEVSSGLVTFTGNASEDGDADLDATFGVTTTDTTALEFDFQSDGGTLFFNFVFASDEYNEFVNQQFNDAFALYLDGVNIALVPGTTTPISINNVNGGNPLGTDATNPQFYRNNTSFLPGEVAEIPTLFGYDGLTHRFTAQASGLDAGTHTIKMVISDVGDTDLDSAVFIEGGTFSDTIAGASGGDWGSVTIDQFANDRNVGIYVENESDAATAPGTNAIPDNAEFLGELAPLEDVTRAGDLDPLTGPSQTLRGGGDAALRLGFHVEGSLNETNDVDVYSFRATSGSEVWLDIDGSRHSLDTVIDLIDVNGTILASTDSTLAEQTGQNSIYENPASVAAGLKANTLNKSLFESDDFFTTNQRDAGMRVVLPGTAGAAGSIYYVRVRSSSIDSLDNTADRNDLLTLESISSGRTSGRYELQVRLREKDEVAGSTVRYADIRFATDGIRILGQPTHSPLQGEFSEAPDGDVSNSQADAPNLGNVLNTDHGAISISAALDREDDIDWFQFDVIPDSVRDSAIENPNGPLVFEGGAPIIFDLDYADDNGGGNTRLSIFNSAGQLVLFSDDSNITDDRPAGNEPGGDADDTSRGSVGDQDPFIGPIELPAGTYYAVVTSKALLPSALEYLLQEPGAALDEVRLETVNSLTRIADEHFDPFFGELLDIDQATAAEPIVDLFTPDVFGDLPQNVVPWELSDVTLYISTHEGMAGNSQTLIRTVDAFSGLTETVVGPRVGGVQPVDDIAMRYDGEIFGYATGPVSGVINDSNTQTFLNFSTANGAAAASGGSDISTFFRNAMNAVTNGNNNAGFGFNIDAIAYTGTADDNGLMVGHRNSDGTQITEPMNDNILFRFNVDTGRASHTDMDVSTMNGFHADFQAGTNRPAIGFIDTVGDGGTGLTGGLGGLVTGIAFPDASRGLNSRDGFGITNRGELHAFNLNRDTTASNGSVVSSFMADIGTMIGRPGINFQGLAAGPDDVEPLPSNPNIGRYEDVLFAVSDGGLLVAIDVSGVSFFGSSITGSVELAPVLSDGQSFVQLTDEDGFPLNNITGLDFGTLTRNLWHISQRDIDDTGHGPETPFDFSRTYTDDGFEGDSQALFFGNDIVGSTAGNRNNRGRNNTFSDVRSLDFPNGAAGSIISNEFDLSSYTAADNPVLQFNYYLQTEDAEAAWVQDTDEDNHPMRDSFRVFVGGDDGVWNLVATNNSLQEPETNQRIDEFDYGPIDPNDPLSIQEPITDGTGTYSTFPLGQDYQDVVELYDDPVHQPDGAGETWYAARIDLSSYAGRKNLRLRFDFSTAGGMDFADGLFSTLGVSINDVTQGQRTEEVLALPAAELRDGQRIEIDGNGVFTDIDAFNAGSTVVAPTGDHFEFDFGHMAVAPSGSSIADGETFTVDGTVFEFEKTLPAVATNAVLITDYATTGDVAKAIADAVNGASLPGVTAILQGNRVNFAGATTLDVNGTPALTADGAPGVRAGHHAINVTLDMDREAVALALKTAIATRYSASNTVTVPEVESNDTPATAQSLENQGWSRGLDQSIGDLSGVNTSETIPHISVSGSGNGTLDLYAFSATAGSRGIFDIDNTTVGLDTQLRILQSDGTDITSSILTTQQQNTSPLDPGSTPFFSGSTFSLDALLEVVFPATDTYIVEVSSFGGVPTGTSYVLHASVEGHVLDFDTSGNPRNSVDAEPNNVGTEQNLEDGIWTTIDNSDVFFASSDPHVTVMSAGDGTATVDRYTFTVPAGGNGDVIVDIDNTTGGFDASLQLFNSVGTLIASNLAQPADPGSGSSVSDPYLVFGHGGALEPALTPGETYTIEVNGATLGSSVPVGAGYELHLSVDGHSTVTVPAAYTGATIDPLNIKGFHQLGYLELTGHNVTNNGPLGWSNTLPGDEFGAFGVSSTAADGWLRSSGALRGVNNRIEGVWLDDIVIGFAERGEMVTNAPVNTDFRIDTRIYGNSFDANGNVDRDHPNYTGTPNNLDQLTGAYTLEIRRASEYAVQIEDFPVKTRLFRSFDSNDRLANAVTLHAPKVEEVADGMTFTLSDGIDSVTFEFNDINLAGGVASGHVAIPIDPVTDGFNVDSDTIIASTIASVINGTDVSNVLALSATAVDDRVEVFGDGRLVLSSEPSLGVTGRIAADVETTHQTSPAGRLDTFQLENTATTENITSAVLTLPDGHFFDLRDTFDPVDAPLYEGADPVASPLSDEVGASFFGDAAMTQPLQDGDTTAYIQFTNFAPGERYLFNVGVSHYIDVHYLQTLTPNVATADSGSRHLIGSRLIATFDTNRTVEQQFMDSRLFDFDNGVSEAVLAATPFGVTIFEDFGDRNTRREQGQIIIESNTISDSANFGIVSGPGVANLNAHDLGNFAPGAGVLRGQGAARSTIELNDLGLVPGIVIENNILVRGGAGGIDFSGDPNGVAPFGRIVNNTILGDEDATGTGIRVHSNASPTVINNALARLDVGISVDADSDAAGTVTGANFYVDNSSDHGGVATYGTFDASDKQTGNPNWTVDGTFVDVSVTNLYPAAGSPLIDSSLDSLSDRAEFVTIRDPLGIAESPVLAPNLDAFGQTRADDDTPGTGPGAPGANVRKDRGAVDRVDFANPQATVLVIDSRIEGAFEVLDEQVRLDNAGEVISSESDAEVGNVGFLETGAASARRFVLRFSDLGIGIDDAPILAAVEDISGATPLPFTLMQDDELLVRNVDYTFTWNNNTDEAIFTHLTEFPIGHTYTIHVDNDPASGARSDLPGAATDPHPDDGVTGIRDLAGNYVDINKEDGTTQFSIQLNVLSLHDAPEFDVPVANPPAVDEDAAPVTIPNFITGISLGTPAETAQFVEFDVTTSIVTGNVAFAAGPDISPDGTLTYELADDTNGVVRFSITAADNRYDNAVSEPAFVELTVNPVNDAPVFTLDGSVSIDSDEDSGPQGPFNLVSSFGSGPATAIDETTTEATRQSVTFHTANQITTVGNLTLNSLSVVDGVLTYEATPNTSGTLTFELTLQDDGSTSYPGDQNTSAPQVVTINVAALPDAPVPSSVNYVIDETATLNLDASATTDPDLGYAGSGVTEVLSYSWDLNNDGTFDIVDSPNATIAVPYSTLESLGLTAPGSSTITLRVTDTFDGTAVTTTADLQIVTVDYGDAPDTFMTTIASGNPAAHTIVPGFFLGESVDGEVDGVVPPAEDGADEDGIVFEAGMQTDAVIDTMSFFNATASQAGKLDVWIDFDNDGVFQPDEHLNGGTSFDLNAGDNRVEFPIAAGSAVTGTNLWARARFSSAGGLSPTGRANDGEVEDYQIQISPLLDPVDIEHDLPMWSQTSDLTPLLRWQQVSGSPIGANATHRVELRDSLNQVVGFEEDHPFNYIEVSDPLTPGTYTLVVTPFNRAGVAGLRTTLGSFEVVAMTVTAPAGNVSNGFPQIEWTSVSQTDRYELEIRSVATDLIVLEERNLPTNSYDVSTELPLGDYTIRVRAIEETTGQPGDWSPETAITVQTVPVLTAPIGTITDTTPDITWQPVAGAVTYDVRIVNITDDVNPQQLLTNISGTTTSVTSALPLGEYTIQVRGVSGQGVQGAWSMPSSLLVQPPVTINTPGDRTPDVTPTVSWNAVSGADTYSLQIVNTQTSSVVVDVDGLTTTQYTVPAGDALTIGLYELVVTAVNNPQTGSGAAAIMTTSAASPFTISDTPEILSPNVSTYDTTPEITWTLPAGAATSEVEVYNLTTDSIQVVRSNLQGTSTTVALDPGDYRIRVRSFGGTNGAVASDWSTPHVFRIGAAPVALGPSDGFGTAPFTRTSSVNPTLTAEQSLSGVTYRFWLASVTTGEAIEVTDGVESASYTVQQDLPVGRYRYWVQATTSFGEQSPWSRSYDFDVTTTPVLSPVNATFDRFPTFRWNLPSEGRQPEITSYQVWINKVDVVPAQIVIVENEVTGNEFNVRDYLPEGLERGRHMVWVRGFVQGVSGTTTTEWSNGVQVEIGGRPTLNPFGDPADDTPLISWNPVDGAATYELYLAAAGSISSPITRITDLTSTEYQVTEPLSDGTYYAWIRARSTTGERSPWSLNANSRFTISEVSRAVVDPIATSDNSTPTFTWSTVTGATRYEIFVSSVESSGTAIIRDDGITATSYTSAVSLPAGDFRVWIRAIGSTGQPGLWSAPERFTIASLDQQEQQIETESVLVSLEAASARMSQHSVTVVPADDVASTSHVQTAQAASKTRLADNVTSVAADNMTSAEQVEDSAADDVMSDWDDMIWAEESSVSVPGRSELSAAETTETPEKTGRNWLAGLALLSPSFLRRRNRNQWNS